MSETLNSQETAAKENGAAVTAAESQTLSPEEMVNAIIEARGGLPKPDADEEISEREQALIESNFQMETRFLLQDMQRIVESKIPDVSDQQSFAIAAAMTKGDLGSLIDAVLAAHQRVQEIDDKTQEQKSLHVEGGASGDPTQTTGKGLGVAGVFERISNLYSNPA